MNKDTHKSLTSYSGANLKIKILATALGLIIFAVIIAVLNTKEFAIYSSGCLTEKNGIVKFQNTVLCSLEVNKVDGILDFPDKEYDGIFVRKIKNEIINYRIKNPNNTIKMKITDTLKIATWNAMTRSVYSSKANELEISCNNDNSTVIYFDSINTKGIIAEKFNKKTLRIMIWNDSMKIDTGIIGDEQACLCEQPDGYKDNSTIRNSKKWIYRYNDLNIRNEVLKNHLNENIQTPYIMTKFNGEVTCSNAISTLNFIKSNIAISKSNSIAYFNDIDWRITKIIPR